MAQVEKFGRQYHSLDTFETEDADTIFITTDLRMSNQPKNHKRQIRQGFSCQPDDKLDVEISNILVFL